MERRIEAFIDLRSPYSYLAIGPARQLAEKYKILLDWLPYCTDFRSAYGGGIEQRSARDVAKLKYLYMDCRRLAKKQGLTIRATTKLWNPMLAHMAFLFAKQRGRLWAFLDPTLEAFWRREFDLESEQALEEALVRAGLDAHDWQEFGCNEGGVALTAAADRADELGVFGAPTFIFDGEMFWGGDRLAMLCDRLGYSVGIKSPV